MKQGLAPPGLQSPATHSLVCRSINSIVLFNSVGCESACCFFVCPSFVCAVYSVLELGSVSCAGAKRVHLSDDTLLSQPAPNSIPLTCSTISRRTEHSPLRRPASRSPRRQAAAGAFWLLHNGERRWEAAEVLLTLALKLCASYHISIPIETHNKAETKIKKNQRKEFDLFFF